MDKVKVEGREYEVYTTDIKRPEDDPLYMKANMGMKAYCYIEGDRVKVKNDNLLIKIYKKWKNKQNAD